MSNGVSIAADAAFPERAQESARASEAAEARRKPRPPFLPAICGHADLCALERADLPALAEEVRQRIIEVVLTTGGHLGSNFGVVELTIALHYVFDFAQDSLVLDVGHQCYPHKLLTGRTARFHTLRTRGGISGYPHPGESSHDVMRSGHAGTAISMGLGIAAADGLLGRKQQVVCLVGDSSLGAGVALEGLNYADQVGRDVLVILNDNEMSISKTVGSLAGYLNRLRSAPIYTGAKERLRALLRSVPFGDKLDKNLVDMVDALKAAIAPGHLFEELGFRYFGPIDGHDIGLLIDQLEALRRVGGVKLLHVVTKKGKGLERTGEDTRFLHAVSPGACLPGYNAADGVVPKEEAAERQQKTEIEFTEAFGQAIVAAAERDPRIVAITAAMPEGTGLTEFARRFPERFHDTGITEQHAVAFAGGLARGGARPVCAIYSSFLQRAYDQFFQEVVFQDLPVVFCLDRSGLVGQDGPSHHGCHDIAFLRTYPNVILCAPRDAAELQAMLDLGLSQDHPFVLRYPRGKSALAAGPAPAVEIGKAEILRSGEDVTLVAYGALAGEALRAAAILSEHGLEAAVVNARFAKPLDLDLLLEQAARTRLLVTIEEHQLMGGFGSAVLEAFACRGRLAERVLPIGIPDRLIEHGSRAECLADAGLTAADIVRQVLARLAVG
ncbi:MAG: 1-deoxy-D-xylulose-5-phosphate synthase [Planctomycetes bacterium]|nr:1-deoxy-D-xylulose-5-phosphate synthase [Planctomycetota bacterium]